MDSVNITRQVDSLVTVCRSLTAKKQFEEAILVIERAESITLANYGKENALYATCLFNHGRILAFDNKLGLALPVYEEAKNIREKVLGKMHPDYAWSLNNLGSVYRSKGNYSLAEKLHKEALQIRLDVLGRKHQDYSASLNNLANVYADKEQYEQAEALLLEALALREEVLGVEHPEYAKSLNNLAFIYTRMSHYSKAKELYLKAVRISKQQIIKGVFNYFDYVNNLAGLYIQTGEYQKAEQLLLEAKLTYEESGEKNKKIYFLILSTIAYCYYDQKQYTDAKRLLDEILFDSKIETLPSLELFSIYNEYALILQSINQYTKAEYYFEQARNVIIDENIVKKFQYIPTILNNLGQLYLEQKKYDKAEPFLLESVQYREKHYSKTSFKYSFSLYRMALLYRAAKSYSKATALLTQANEIDLQLAERILSSSSEGEYLAFKSTSERNKEVLLSFLQEYPVDSLKIAAYNNNLFYNNNMLESTIRLRNTIVQADTNIQQLYEEYRWRHAVLAREYALPKAERDSVKVVQWQGEAEEYEKQLIRHFPEFASSRNAVQWEQVRDHLKPGEAAIEFLHYRYISPTDPTDSFMYAALVLRPGDTSPVFVSLCEQHQLDSLMQLEPADLYIGRRYSTKPLLFNLLWRPLEPFLQGIHTVYYTPSGDLYRINPAAIQYPDGRRLLERYNLISLSSTRNIVPRSDQAQPVNYPLTAVLVGNINYNIDTTYINEQLSELASLPRTSRRSISRNIQAGETSPLSPLPFSKPEIDGIASTLHEASYQVKKLEGHAATEETVKLIGEIDDSPGILLFSTHGLFTPSKVSRSLKDDFGSVSAIDVSENPMLRSMLFLAGANHARISGRPLEGFEDGILTAYEATQMNLQHTELVALPACQSGQGDIHNSEGVYGLQRAFRLAGAKYVLVTLWPVDDEATQLLMNRFFQNWKTAKMPIRTALQEAQLWLQQQKEEFRNPFYWGGFIIVE